MHSTTRPDRLCDYCGLPVGKTLGVREEAVASYCCTGCRFAHAITSDTGEEGSNRWMLTKLGIAIFFSMNVMVLTLALWAYDGSRLGDAPRIAEALSDLFRFACLLLTFPVLVLLGRPLLEQALDDLSQFRFSTDLLVLSGVLASFVYSTISVWRGEGDIYFEVGCMILVFVTLGRWLEATGKLRSTASLDQLQQLLPEEVLILQSDMSRRRVPREEIRIGDKIIVRSGERFPIDGVIIEGQTTIDEQLITGESWPVERSLNDRVIGGTIALDGEVIVRVDVTQNGTVLQRLVEAVKAARLEKSDTQRLADRITQFFIPATLLLAIGTFAFHAIASSIMTGVLTALSVILIACPCGLGLATPMTLWAAVGVAARRGIAFNSTQVLESLANIKAIRFDKTGTLTTGTPVVKSLITDGETSTRQIDQRAKQLAQSSNHVFSRAILDSIKEDVSLLDIRPTSQAGKGVYGTVSGEFKPTALGSLPLMRDLDIECPPRLERALEQAQREGHPVVSIGWASLVRGLFIFEEQSRAGVTEMFAKCREFGLDLGILTGDSSDAAKRFATTAGVPALSGLSPRQKQIEIQKIQREIGPVALVGDGMNDVVALSAADVGLCLGCGADVSRDAADICLVGDDLSQIPWLVELSQQTMKTIRTNLTWVFAYNGIGMTIAVTGMLHPAVAAALMVVSSVFVITNSLRLQARYSDPGDQVDVSPGAKFHSNQPQASDQTQRQSTSVRSRPTESFSESSLHTQSINQPALAISSAKSPNE
ncbi:heavy metal translocating P-type ATPase [Thalassoglobus polymorphus]|uniref:Copper-exporting P-type ATPase A n=1 Tax=Thalassoglobus polymorphus TaxID=2527994 RepID=A0A517QMN0_9PLAN|nr:cation-translocating P-type ATPase [Thalassoglobus polymorphus]QDT32888.1 Copper-exporting P-type ATPase A [Thalassoglobus polymorphus]